RPAPAEPGRPAAALRAFCRRSVQWRPESVGPRYRRPRRPGPLALAPPQGSGLPTTPVTWISLAGGEPRVRPKGTRSGQLPPARGGDLPASFAAGSPPAAWGPDGTGAVSDGGSSAVRAGGDEWTL